MTHALLLRRPRPSTFARTRLYAVSQCSLTVLLEALKYRDFLAARELWRQEVEMGARSGKLTGRVFHHVDHYLPQLNLIGD